jgi:hypothetical protein
MIASRPLAALWGALVLQLLGRLVDLRWHLANDEFEGTSQQLEAHWLIWLGVAATVAVAAVALRQHRAGPGAAAFALVLGSGLLYVGVAVWHFVEHANGADPELAHYLLALTQLGMVAGAALATLAARGKRLRMGGPA